MKIQIDKDLAFFKNQVLIKKNAIFSFEDPKDKKAMLINGEQITPRQYMLISDFVNGKLGLILEKIKNKEKLIDGDRDFTNSSILNIIRKSFDYLHSTRQKLEPFTPAINLVKFNSDLKKYLNII